MAITKKSLMEELELMVRDDITSQETIIRLSKENKELENKINKAIQYIEELISDTKGIINAYNYEDKENTIKRYIEDLETDIKNYEYLEYILRGKKDE